MSHPDILVFQQMYSADCDSSSEIPSDSVRSRETKQICLDALECLIFDDQKAPRDTVRRYAAEQLYEIISGFEFDLDDFSPHRFQDLLAEPYIHQMSANTRESCLRLLNVQLEALSVPAMKELIRELLRTASPDIGLRNAIQQLGLTDFHWAAPELFSMKLRSRVVPQSTWKRQFEVPYRNISNVQNAIEVFKINLTKHPSRPFVTLVDSSKAGKSRMIAEAAKMIPTIYVSFCSEGYPPRTEKSLGFFKALKKKTKDRDKRIGIMRRSIYYAIDKLNEVIAGLPAGDGRYEALWNGQIAGEIALFDAKYIVEPTMSKNEREQVWNRFLKLTSDQHSPLRLLLAIDEASYLMREESIYDESTDEESDCEQPTLTTSPNTLLSMMREALAKLSSINGIYTVMFDKTYDIMSWEDEHIPEPIRFSIVDVCLENCPLSLRITHDENHYMRLGRPVWDNSGEDYSQRVRLATQILNNGNSCVKWVSKLAAFMCVFGIEVDNTPSNFKQLFTYRMASLFGEKYEPGILAYYSEPILAHGAHRILEELPNRLFYFLKFFFFNDYIINSIESIMARVLILQRLTQQTPKDNFFAGAQTNLMRLDVFLDRINLSKAICATDADLKFGLIHFSHWDNHFIGNLWVQSLVFAYYRGAGLICHWDSFDFLIPVFIDKKENHDAIESMKKSAFDLRCGEMTDAQWNTLASMFSFIAIQVNKGRHAGDPEAFVKARNEDFSGFSDLPGYIFYIQLCGSDEDEVIKDVTEKKHCYIRRTGLEQWHLSPPEQARASELLDLICH